MRGFVYTLEAIAAIISLVSIIVLLQVPAEDYSSVVLYKQASDLANELARTKDFGNASALARQLGLKARVTACGTIVMDDSPRAPVVIHTLYYDGGYCELVVEASRH